MTKAESLLLDPSCALPQEDAAAEREGRRDPRHPYCPSQGPTRARHCHLHQPRKIPSLKTPCQKPNLLPSECHLVLTL